MADPQPINTSTMPGDNLSPGLITSAAGQIRGVGSKISTQGGVVLTRWQKLSGSYDAPEDETLFHSMDPVKTAAERFGTDLGQAATALETFADEVERIKAAASTIRSEAAAFKAEIAGGVEVNKIVPHGSIKTTVDWFDDAGSRNTNNDLISRTNDLQEQLWAAERTCATAIRGVVGLGPILAASDSNPNGYGVEEIPDGTEMPWGAKVDAPEGCGESVLHGAADGLGGMLGGFANLVGFKYTGTGLWDSWDWSWDWSWGNMGEAWAGVGKFALGAATTGLITTPMVMTMPGPVGDFLRSSQQTFAGGMAGMVGIDIYADDPFHKWKDDPARAFGELGFNVVTVVVAPAKVGNLGKAGRVGAAVDRVASATDPLYWATKAARGVERVLPGLGRTAEALQNLFKVNKAADIDGNVRITTDLDIPSVPRDHVGTDTPNVGNDRPGGGTDADVPPVRDQVDTPDRAPTESTNPEPTRPGDVDTTTPSDTGDAPPQQAADPYPQPVANDTLPSGQERQTWEREAVPTSGLQRVDADHPMPQFSTSSPNELGRIGEQLTEAELKRQGWDIVFSGRHVEMPGDAGRYFVPDFIARDPNTGAVIAVESKMGPGAHFTDSQLTGYEKLANGDSLEMRSKKVQEVLVGLGITKVDAVQVYRWGTEFVPDDALITAAGVGPRVVK